MTRPLAGPQTLLRTLNARAILEALARRGNLTRAELMGETGLSRTAVTQVLRMLDAGEAVASAGEDRGTRGPAAARVSLNPNLGFAAAVHVDHHSASVSLVDPAGEIRAEAHARFSATDDRAMRIVGLIGDCLQASPGSVKCAVVGVPGIVTADGSVRNDLGPDGGAFRSALEAGLGCAVRVENDVNLAALAESAVGVGAGISSFALLMLEDGLGAGFIINGALHRGASGVAGEVQFLPQSPLPIAAPVLGDTVVADLALTFGRDPAEPMDAHLEACAAGDPAAEQMVDEMARRLVIVAGSITLVLDPAAFILAGYATHPCFVERIKNIAEEYAALLPMQFLVSGFGREAPLIGAINHAAATLRDTVFDSILSHGKSGR
ncbi:MAG TPA: ROK family transcriptional regulator [Microbacterium sp.]|nr:ROK family transcriptional regulator [Microbacterium sp.]